MSQDRLEEITANATTNSASAPDVCSVDSALTLHRMLAEIVVVNRLRGDQSASSIHQQHTSQKQTSGQSPGRDLPSGCCSGLPAAWQFLNN